MSSAAAKFAILLLAAVTFAPAAAEYAATRSPAAATAPGSAESPLAFSYDSNSFKAQPRTTARPDLRRVRTRRSLEIKTNALRGAIA